jgi:hypothetical protein
MSTMKRVWFPSSCAISALVCVALSSPAGAQTTDLRSIESEVTTLTAAASSLSIGYGSVGSLTRDLDLADRLSEAQVRIFLGQYDEAATILVDLVENRSFRSLAGWPQARFELGEALVLGRNYTLARGYFEEIVQDADATYSSRAAGRLLEIALALNEYDRLDALYTDLQRVGGAASVELAYVRGKALYFQNRDADAYNALAQIPDGHELYERAQYFIGVVQTRAAQYDQALATFSAIVDRLEGSPDGDNRDIHDLAVLAVGRVYYEMRDFVMAERWYGRILPDSSRADVGAYELAWTQIKRDNIRDALTTLQLLEVVATDRRFRPESQLLRADLLMRINNYDDAVVLFEEIANEFQLADAELRASVETRQSADAWFRMLVDPETASLRLPSDSEPWFRSNPDIDRALSIVSDRETARENIDMCQSIIAELDAVLNTETSVGLFPEFREAWGRGLDVSVDVVEQRRRLIEFEASRIPGAATSAEYQQLRSQRLSLEQEYLQTPRSFDEVSSRSQAVSSALQGDEFDVFRTIQEVEGFLDEIDALRRILQRQVARGERTVGQARSAGEQLDRVEADFRQQLREAEEVIEGVRISQLRASRGPGLTDSDQAVRQRYLDALARERAALSGMRAGFGEAGQVDSLHAQLESVDRTLDQFFAGVEGRVAELTSDAREIIEEERAAMERYLEVLSRTETAAQTVLGEIAYAAFAEVQRSFSELTLRANLGILDVAWRQKEALSNRIEGLFESRDREFQVLDADFVEIRESSP